MSAHAKLSPSSASRWLSCPGSIALTDQAYPDGVPDQGSVYAQEGTLAHEVAEIYAKKRLGQVTESAYRSQRTKLKKQVEALDFDFDEMTKHARGYADLIEDIILEATDQANHLAIFENRVHPSIPGVWGTADAIVVVDGELHVIDYKYGKGVVVEAEENPQLKLYALGAINLVDETLGEVLGELEVIHALVYQPRASSVAKVHTYSRRELMAWQYDYALPRSVEATSGSGEINPSDEACRWCPVAGLCGPRRDQLVKRDFKEPDLMSPEELAVELGRVDEIAAWCTSGKNASLELAYHQGVKIPGYKVVRARANRKIGDKPAAIEALVEAGYDRQSVQRIDTETLSRLDKLVGGKDRLQEVLGDLLTTPPGRETLVHEDDPRQDITQMSDAVDEFADDPSAS